MTHPAFFQQTNFKTVYFEIILSPLSVFLKYKSNVSLLNCVIFFYTLLTREVAFLKVTNVYNIHILLEMVLLYKIILILECFF